MRELLQYRQPPPTVYPAIADRLDRLGFQVVGHVITFYGDLASVNYHFIRIEPLGDGSIVPDDICRNIEGPWTGACVAAEAIFRHILPLVQQSLPQEKLAAYTTLHNDLDAIKRAMAN